MGQLLALIHCELAVLRHYNQGCMQHMHTRLGKWGKLVSKITDIAITELSSIFY